MRPGAPLGAVLALAVTACSASPAAEPATTAISADSSVPVPTTPRPSTRATAPSTTASTTLQDALQSYIDAQPVLFEAEAARLTPLCSSVTAEASSLWILMTGETAECTAEIATVLNGLGFDEDAFDQALAGDTAKAGRYELVIDTVANSQLLQVRKAIDEP